MGDTLGTVTAGVYPGGYRRGATSTDRWDQYVVPVRDRISSYKGRACSVRIPGIAGTTGQNILSIFNADATGVLVEVQKIFVDVMQTAAKVIEPPAIRIYRVSAAPTGGSAITKAPLDTALTSDTDIAVLQGASAENTASAITATTGALVSEEWAPRVLTLVGYETADRLFFLDDAPVLLRQSEGLLLRLDYSAAGANPVTDKWVCGVQWEEFTRP